MATGRVAGGAGGAPFVIVVDPDPKQIAKDIRRKINRPMAKVVGQVNKKQAQMAVAEIKRRSASAPRGQVRIGRAAKASATAAAITVRVGGARFPDIGGQIWGSHRFERFDAYTGGRYENTYVIGPMLRDERFMNALGEAYVDEISDLLKRIWGNYG
jgi:hypothetical protein